MKSAGITTIDHARQVEAKCLHLLQTDLRWRDRGRTCLFLRDTRYAVPDLRTVDQAVGRSYNLPLLISGIWFDGRVQAMTPAKRHPVDDLLRWVMASVFDDPLVKTHVAVAAVFAFLRRQTSPGQDRQVAWAAHRPLRELLI